MRVPGLAGQLGLVEEELDHLIVGGRSGSVVEPVVRDLYRHARFVASRIPSFTLPYRVGTSRTGRGRVGARRGICGR